MEELLRLLKRYFGYSSFRPMQAEIIQNIVNKKDSLVLMPTGGGKSICYQLPAICMKGTAIVISPLIALMKDQVDALVSNGIPAAAINSTLSFDTQMQVEQLCLQGKIKLLYLSPERVVSEADRLMQSLDISLIAIDEAHCISHWGHDFRPEYTQLAFLKERFPNVPLIALTATADKRTREDIMEQLKLDHPNIFISSFDRPNLFISVKKLSGKKEKMQAIFHFIKDRLTESGIIYCMKRDDTETVARELMMKGVKAAAYHAGLASEEREKVQNDFINDRIDIICATVAFGMGIDKSNVRWIIHYNMPKSIENYYQEIGRAGRDGMPGNALLFYSPADMIVLRHFAEESGQMEMNIDKLEQMQRFCEANICRRRILLSYFGEAYDHDCGNCDVCRNPKQTFDGTIIVQKALSAITRTGEHVGMLILIGILRASAQKEIIARGYDRLKTYGAGRDFSQSQWRDYIEQMLQLGFIEVDYNAAGVLRVTDLGRKVLFENMKVELAKPFEREIKPKVEKEKKHTFRASPIKPVFYEDTDPTLFESLRQLRMQIAQKENIPPYIVFTDDSLNDMVDKKPLTMEAFSEIRGVGQIKQRRFGKVFVSLIRYLMDLPPLK